MKRPAGLTILLLMVLSADASNPTRAQKVRPRPIQSAEPPLAVPVPAPQPARAAAEPIVPERVWQAVLYPERALARLVVSRLIGYPDDPIRRMNRLLSESEDL